MKNYFTFIKNYTWTIPFFLFWAGYYTISTMIPQRILIVPSLIGLSLSDATLKLSQTNLALTVIQQKEDDSIQEHTVISQTPTTGKKIKPHQTVSVIITRRIRSASMPDLRGACIQDITLSSTPIISEIPSNHPANTCIAQIPYAGAEINSKKHPVLYAAAPTTSLVLMPTLINYTVAEIEAFAVLYGIKVRITHETQKKSHHCNSCIVKAQQPQAHSFVDLKTLKTIFVYV